MPSIVSKVSDAHLGATPSVRLASKTLELACCAALTVSRVVS